MHHLCLLLLLYIVIGPLGSSGDCDVRLYGWPVDISTANNFISETFSQPLISQFVYASLNTSLSLSESGLFLNFSSCPGAVYWQTVPGVGGAGGGGRNYSLEYIRLIWHHFSLFGSEHSIDGKLYPMEAQLFLSFNSGSLLRQLVVSVFFDIVKQQSSAFQVLLDTLGQNVVRPLLAPAFPLHSLFSLSSVDPYYSYRSGSQDCGVEEVDHVVLANPRFISSNQLLELQQLHFRGEQYIPTDRTQYALGLRTLLRYLPAVDCVLTPWAAWGSCVGSCGQGTRLRLRSVLTPPLRGGNACGVLIETSSCTSFLDSPICLQSDWSAWSPCTLACGIGDRFRYRSTYVAGSEAVCGPEFEKAPCSMADCEVNACINNPCRLAEDPDTGEIGPSSVCVDLPLPALDTEEGRICVDINACTGFPCGAGFKCVDRPSPALNNTNGRTCIACDGVTEYQDEAGALECKPMAVPCAIGEFQMDAPSASSGRVCVPCGDEGEPTVDHDDDPMTPCENCGPGSFMLPRSSGPCSNYVCPVGTTSFNDTRTSCAECVENGLFVPAGSFLPCDALKCPAGTIDSDGDSRTQCVSCPPGRYIPPGTYGNCSSFACPAGSTDDDYDSSTPCLVCPPGVYLPFNGSFSPCSFYSCPSGWIDDDYDPLTPCVPCVNSGLLYVPPSSSGSCDAYPCPVGTLDSDFNSSTPCEDCSPGAYVPPLTRNDSCYNFLCPAGTYDHDKNSTTPCVMCPEGFYQPSMGQHTCLGVTVCGPGYEDEKLPSADGTTDGTCRSCVSDPIFGTYRSAVPGSSRSCLPALVCPADMFTFVQATTSSNRVCNYICTAHDTDTCFGSQEECANSTSFSDANCQTVFNRRYCSSMNQCGSCLDGFDGPMAGNTPCTVQLPPVLLWGADDMSAMIENVTQSSMTDSGSMQSLTGFVEFPLGLQNEVSASIGHIEATFPLNASFLPRIQGFILGDEIWPESPELKVAIQVADVVRGMVEFSVQVDIVAVHATLGNVSATCLSDSEDGSCFAVISLPQIWFKAPEVVLVFANVGSESFMIGFPNLRQEVDLPVLKDAPVVPLPSRILHPEDMFSLPVLFSNPLVLRSFTFLLQVEEGLLIKCVRADTSIWDVTLKKYNDTAWAILGTCTNGLCLREGGSLMTLLVVDVVVSNMSVFITRDVHSFLVNFKTVSMSFQLESSLGELEQAIQPLYFQNGHLSPEGHVSVSLPNRFVAIFPWTRSSGALNNEFFTSIPSVIEIFFVVFDFSGLKRSIHQLGSFVCTTNSTEIIQLSDACDQFMVIESDSLFLAAGGGLVSIEFVWDRFVSELTFRVWSPIAVSFALTDPSLELIPWYSFSLDDSNHCDGSYQYSTMELAVSFSDGTSTFTLKYPPTHSIFENVTSSDENVAFIRKLPTDGRYVVQGVNPGHVRLGLDFDPSGKSDIPVQVSETVVRPTYLRLTVLSSLYVELLDLDPVDMSGSGRARFPLSLKINRAFERVDQKGKYLVELMTDDSTGVPIDVTFDLGLTVRSLDPNVVRILSPGVLQVVSFSSPNILLSASLENRNCSSYIDNLALGTGKLWAAASLPLTVSVRVSSSVLTIPSDPSSHTPISIPTTVQVSVFLQYEGNHSVNVALNSNTIYDYPTEIFELDQLGDRLWLIARRPGNATLRVMFANNDLVAAIPIQVVYSSRLLLQSTPFPSYLESSTHFEQGKYLQIFAGTSLFQQSALKVWLQLCNGSIYDVSPAAIISMDQTPSNSSNSSSSNLLVLSDSLVATPTGTPGHVNLSACFASIMCSDNLTITVSDSDPVYPVMFLNATFSGINNYSNSYFSGIASRARTTMNFDCLLSDGTVVPSFVSNGLEYLPGSVSFTLLNDTIDNTLDLLPGGGLTLLGNSLNPVAVVATSILNSSIQIVKYLTCKLDPDVGDVDLKFVGNNSSSLSFPLASGDLISVDVFVNAGGNGLQVIEVSLFFDSSFVKFHSVIWDTSFLRGGSCLYFLEEANASISDQFSFGCLSSPVFGLVKIAELTFRVGHVSGITTLSGAIRSMTDASNMPVGIVPRPIYAGSLHFEILLTNSSRTSGSRRRSVSSSTGIFEVISPYSFNMGGLNEVFSRTARSEPPTPCPLDLRRNVSPWNSGVMGDANRNLALTLDDVLFIRQFLLEELFFPYLQDSLLESQINEMDVDQNSVITARDAWNLFLIRYRRLSFVRYFQSTPVEAEDSSCLLTIQFYAYNEDGLPLDVDGSKFLLFIVANDTQTLVSSHVETGSVVQDFYSSLHISHVLFVAPLPIPSMQPSGGYYVQLSLNSTKKSVLRVSLAQILSDPINNLKDTEMTADAWLYAAQIRNDSLVDTTTERLSYSIRENFSLNFSVPLGGQTSLFSVENSMSSPYCQWLNQCEDICEKNESFVSSNCSKNLPSQICTPCRICPAGTFAVGGCTGGSRDRECQRCDGTESYQDEINQSSCKTAKTCGPGFTMAFPPTPLTDRICVSCLKGESYKPSGPSEGSCRPVTFCLPGTIEVVPPTISTDRQCRQCTPGLNYQPNANSTSCILSPPCSAGFAPSYPLSSTEPLQCESCILNSTFKSSFEDQLALCRNVTPACGPEELEFMAPTTTSDRICGVVRSVSEPCLNSEYELSSSPRRCVPLQICSNNQFELQQPSLTSDRQCKTFRSCSSGLEYVSFPGTSTSDVECKATSECNLSLGFYESSSSTVSSDRICSSVAGACQIFQFEASAPSLTSDRLCQNLTRCQSFQYVQTTATLYADITCANYTTCNLSEFYQTLAPTSTSDRVCSLLTSCQPNQYEKIAPTPSTDRLCSELDDCDFCYEYEMTPPTFSTNRICSSISNCSLFEEFEAVPRTFTSDRSCAPLRLCDSFEYESTPPTFSTNRLCTNYTSCSPQLEYESLPPSMTSDRSCSQITQCNFTKGFYVASSPTETSDSVCAYVHNCSLDFEFVAEPATPTSDTLCQSLTDCDSDSFELEPPRTDSDRICSPFRLCISQLEFEVVPPSPSSDRICAPYTLCNYSFEYEYNTATPTSDRSCRQLSACILDVQFEFAAPTLTSNRLCSNLTSSCPDSTYMRMNYSSTSDRICSNLTVCSNSSEFEIISPTYTSDRVCINATQCSDCEFEKIALTATTDRVCDQLTNCSLSQFIAVNATLTSDRICSPLAICNYSFQFESSPPLLVRGSFKTNRNCSMLTVCNATQFEIVPPLVNRDRRCSAYSECDPTLQYIYTPGNATSDRICALLSSCALGSHVMMRPTSTSDRTCHPCNGVTEYQDQVNQESCKPVSMCPPGSVLLFSATSQSNTRCRNCDGKKEFMDVATFDRICKNTTLFCPAGTAELYPPTSSSDRVCQQCAPETFQPNSGATSCFPASLCPSSSFELMRPTPTTNRVCQSCFNCSVGNYIRTSCSNISDTICSACSLCASREYEVAPCTLQTNRVCASCGDHCLSCKSGDCTVCASGHYLLQYGNSTLCVSDCSAYPGFMLYSPPFTSPSCIGSLDNTVPLVFDVGAPEAMNAFSVSNAREILNTLSQIVSITWERWGPISTSSLMNASTPNVSSPLQVSLYTASERGFLQFIRVSTSYVAENSSKATMVDAYLKFLFETPSLVESALQTSNSTSSFWRRTNFSIALVTSCYFAPCVNGSLCVDLQFPALNNAAGRVCSQCPGCSKEKTFLSRGCDGMNPPVCSPHSNCIQGVSFLAINGSNTSDIQCDICSQCDSNYYVSSPCTNTSNTICTPLSPACSPENSLYMVQANTLTSDRRCAPCSTCNFTNQYIQRNCSLQNNTLCAYLSVCIPGAQFEISPASNYSNRICKPCLQCPFGYFRSDGCSGSQDSICTPWTKCNASVNFISTPGSPTSDRICSSCSVCNGSTEYQVSPCTVPTNTVCAPLTKCNTSQYETMNATLTTDRLCGTCTSCLEYQFKSAGCIGANDTLCKNVTECSSNSFQRSPPSVTSDRVCKNCAICNSTTSFISLSCSQTSDTMCSPMTSCIAGFQYEFIPASHTSDRVCLNCSSCSPGMYKTGGCGESQNTLCAPCPTCLNSQYVVSECTALAPTMCSDCDPTCATCYDGSSTACLSCKPGLVLNGSSCLSQCPSGFYWNGTSCRSCHASCNSCFGPLHSQCSSCTSDLFLFNKNQTSSCVSSCPFGTYPSLTPQSCLPCSSCSNFDVAIGGCNDTFDTICYTCNPDIGEYQDVSGQTNCKRLTDCSPGSYETFSASATNDRTCAPCPESHFQELTNQKSCAPYAIECSPGTYEFRSPTPEQDRVCISCAFPFEFQDLVGQDTCKETTQVCSSGYFLARAPTITSDRVCEMCVEGLEFQDESDMATCKPLRPPCTPGYFLRSAPTISSDRICDPCNGSFFSNTDDALMCTPFAECQSLQYEARSPTFTSDRVCFDITSCSDDEYVSNGARNWSEQVCSPLTECVSGLTFEIVSPTPYSDRVCNTTHTCSLNVTYEVVPATITSDRICASVRNCFFPLEFEATVPGLTSDRICSPVSECHAGLYISTPATPFSDLICSLPSNCSWTQYVIAESTYSSDRICANITDCNFSFQFELSPPHYPKSNNSFEEPALVDRVCSNITLCSPSTFELFPPTNQTNRVCRSLTSCSVGQYELVAPSNTSDRVCAFCVPCPFPSYRTSGCDGIAPVVCSNWSSCPLDTYVKTAGSPTSDVICAACTTCRSGTYAQRPCSLSSDTWCEPWSECSIGMYQLSAGSSSSDVTCTPCSSCPSGSFKFAGCAGGNDTICAPCATSCKDGEYINSKCTSATNTICAPCHPSCKTCSGPSQTQCTSCDANRAMLAHLNGTMECIDSCPLNTTTVINGSIRSCQACDISCQRCSGLTSHDCLECHFGKTLVLNVSDGQCVNLCPAGSFKVVYGNSSDGRALFRCAACSSCPPGQIKVGGCTGQDTLDTLCVPCDGIFNYQKIGQPDMCVNTTTCTDGEIQLVPPTSSSDRICKLCNGVFEYQDELFANSCKSVSLCQIGEGEAVSPSPSTDRVCAPCVAGESFQGDTAGVRCKSTTACLSTEFMTVAPSVSSDRVCSPGTLCWSGQYETTAMTATSDRQCASLTLCDPLTSFISVTSTPTSDVGCSPFTVPSCDFSFQHEAVHRSLTTDRQCQNNTVCSTASYEAFPPSFSTDRVCVACSSNCLKCSNSTICNICTNSTFLFQGACVTDCSGYPGVHNFVNISGVNLCVNTDACIANPCLIEGTTCIDLPPPALNDSSGRICADIDACTSNPCELEGEKCEDLPAPAPNSTLGRKCVDIDACIDFPCSNNMFCTDLQAPAPNGVSGRLCEDRDCLLSPWAPWSSCIFRCGEGSLALRGRSLISAAYGNGRACGAVASVTSCNFVDRDCLLTEWSHWTPCTVGCGQGTSSRGRAIIYDAVGSGLPCGNLTETMNCTMPVCEKGYLCTTPASVFASSSSSEAALGCLDIPATHPLHICQTDAPCGVQRCEDLPAAFSVLLGRDYNCSCDQTLGYNGTADLSGHGCEDLNACVTSPCSPFSTGCIDLPPPAGPTGRTCLPCKSGFSGDGNVCEINVQDNCKDSTYCDNPLGTCMDLAVAPCSVRGTEAECEADGIASMCAWYDDKSPPCRKRACGLDGAYSRKPCHSLCAACTGPYLSNCTAVLAGQSDHKGTDPLVVVAASSVGLLVLIIFVVILWRRRASKKPNPRVASMIQMNNLSRSNFYRREGVLRIDTPSENGFLGLRSISGNPLFDEQLKELDSETIFDEFIRQQQTRETNLDQIVAQTNPMFEGRTFNQPDVEDEDSALPTPSKQGYLTISEQSDGPKKSDYLQIDGKD